MGLSKCALNTKNRLSKGDSPKTAPPTSSLDHASKTPSPEELTPSSAPHNSHPMTRRQGKSGKVWGNGSSHASYDGVGLILTPSPGDKGSLHRYQIRREKLAWCRYINHLLPLIGNMFEDRNSLSSSAFPHTHISSLGRLTPANRSCPNMAIFDEKPSAEERQVPNEAPDALKDLASSAAAQGQGLTGYENLSAWQTVKAFKINALICFFTALSAAAEGYQIQFVYPASWETQRGD